MFPELATIGAPRSASRPSGEEACAPRPRAGAAWPCAALAGLLALGLVLPGAARADDPDEANEVCAPEVSAGRFKVREIGPKIAGSWNARAPGLGFTRGMQEFPVEISFEYGRLYYAGSGVKVELRPVYTRKPLRYDFVRQQPIPESARATELTLKDISVMTNCDLQIAPQFSWEYGTGNRRSNGVLSFMEDYVAIGTMWNSAMGAREVTLNRIAGE